jgi:hypothetical protein
LGQVNYFPSIDKSKLALIKIPNICKAGGGSQVFHTASPAQKVWQWESSRQTQSRPLPQEPCPLIRGCRSCRRANQLLKRGPGSLARGAGSTMHCPWYRLRETLSWAALSRTTGLTLKFAQQFPALGPNRGLPQRDPSYGPSNEKSGNKCGNIYTSRGRELNFRQRKIPLTIGISGIKFWLRGLANHENH